MSFSTSKIESDVAIIPLTCPVCRKQNEDAAPNCARCEAPLEQLRAVITAALGHCCSASSALRRRDYEAVLDHAERSWDLCRNHSIVPIACLAAAAGGYPEDLQAWHLRWRAAIG